MESSWAFVWKDRSDPFDDQNADLGDRRLSRVQEVPSQSVSSASMPSVIRDRNEIDLEAGENVDDWSVDAEAERYAQEGSDNHNLWSSILAKFRKPLAECLAVSPSFLIFFIHKLRAPRQW